MQETGRRFWKSVLFDAVEAGPRPPRRVAMRLGGGVHLLLYGDGAQPLHVRVVPRQDGMRGWFEGAHAVARYTGGDELPPDARRWLDDLGAGLARAEAHEGWAAFVAAAAAMPDVSVGKERPTERMTSGGSVLIRIHEPCNAACDFCSCIGVMPDYAVELPAIERELRAARARGADGVTFTGGEPTLRRDLPDVLRLAASLGFTDVSLQTNAVRLAEPERVRELREAGLTSVFVSLHAHTAPRHDALLRLEGAFDGAVRAIDHLVAAGVLVRLNHVVQRDNAADAPGFARFLVARWGRGVQVTWSFVSPLGRTLEHLDLLPRIADVVPPLREALRTCADAGVEFDVPGLCGLPMCQLPEFAGWFSELRDPSPPPRLETRTYFPGCDGCVVRDRCSGYWKVYAERYGVDEFRALTEVPTRPAPAA